MKCTKCNKLKTKDDFYWKKTACIADSNCKNCLSIKHKNEKKIKRIKEQDPLYAYFN